MVFQKPSSLRRRVSICVASRPISRSFLSIVSRRSSRSFSAASNVLPSCSFLLKASTSSLNASTSRVQLVDQRVIAQNQGSSPQTAPWPRRSDKGMGVDGETGSMLYSLVGFQNNPVGSVLPVLQTSRCTAPLLCAYSRPSPTWSRISRRCSGDSRPLSTALFEVVAVEMLHDEEVPAVMSAYQQQDPGSGEEVEVLSACNLSKGVEHQRRRMRSLSRVVASRRPSKMTSTKTTSSEIL